MDATRPVRAQIRLFNGSTRPNVGSDTLLAGILHRETSMYIMCHSLRGGHVRYLCEWCGTFTCVRMGIGIIAIISNV